MNRAAVGGQALSETLVSVLFLTPLFLYAAYLVDFHRTSHAAGIAVREMALASLHAADGIVSGADLRAIRDLSIPSPEILGDRLPANLETTRASDTASGVERAAHFILAPARLSGTGAFDVPNWQQQRASTGVSMGSTTAIGVPLDIPIELRGTLLFFSGHGASAGAVQVRERTAALSVAGAVAVIASPIETIASIASLIEPALSQLCLGRINPDIVPADRLPASVSRNNDLRIQPC